MQAVVINDASDIAFLIAGTGLRSGRTNNPDNVPEFSNTSNRYVSETTPFRLARAIVNPEQASHFIHAPRDTYIRGTLKHVESIGLDGADGASVAWVFRSYLKYEYKERLANLHIVIDRDEEDK